VKVFRSMGARLQQGVEELMIVIHADNTPDRRRYNVPTQLGAGEVASFTPEEEEGVRGAGVRNIVVRAKGGSLHQIDDLHPAYDPLHFILLFPYGEQGWHLGIPYSDPLELAPDYSESILGEPAPWSGFVPRGRPGPAPRPEPAPGEQDGDLPVGTSRAGGRGGVRGRGGRRQGFDCPRGAPVGLTAADRRNSGCITPQQHTKFRLQWRADNLAFHHAGKLKQEYVVDNFNKVEYQRCKFHATHQDDLRADKYQDVKRAYEGDPSAPPSSVGRRIILASSLTGSPRAMRNMYYDAMAIVRAYGRPDLCTWSLPHLMLTSRDTHLT
jgi:hypothetical protein